MEFHPALDAPHTVSFEGDTLILPVVSHGNVGQLATDLLVASVTGARRIGCLDHPALLPCVGRDAFARDEGDGPGGGHIALGMEVYRVGGGGGGALCLAQQRAEVALGSQRSFAADVAEWIAERGFAEVVVLASAPSTEAKAPGEIGGTSFQHVTASDVPDDRCVAARITHRKTSGGGGGATADQKITREDDDRALPPWSLMRALRAKNVTAVALIATCSEGDNTEDAATMADAVAGVLGLGLEIRAASDEKVDEKVSDGSSRIRWTIPPSWKAAYGQQPMASEIFA
uniref:Proteasome assembly chaperone 2 n=1 Tax=Micromonas pusilla TaxID=38833 RepID=A0A7S0IGG3_MICPS